MSEFLFIIPDGWTKLDWQYITSNLPGMAGPNVASLLQSGAISDIEASLKDGGAIPMDASLVEAKLFNDEVFIVRLGY